MTLPKRSLVCLTVALLIILQAFAQPQTSYSTTGSSAAPILVDSQNMFARIVLDDSTSGLFKLHNSNGAAPSISGSSVALCGSSKTPVYADVVSLGIIKAEKTLVLEASVSADIKSFSYTEEDQFAIFAADDTIKYKGDEFGFVLPETGDTWYAYVQSPEIQGFFLRAPVLRLGASGSLQHDFKAICTSGNSLDFVSFYVDGKLVHKTVYPNVSGQAFQAIFTSHKLSGEGIDTSQNKIEISNASFWNAMEIGSYPKVT
jgi:hypothetical protein